MTKKQKKKMPLLLRMIRWTFPKVEKVAPGLAAKWAWNLFFTPFRFPLPDKEQELADQAKKFRFDSEGYTIQGYEWGEGDKTILLVHGWSGRATQFSSFLPALNASGYKVVAIDGPAHNKSTGKMTEIMRFQGVIQEVLKRYPEISSIITHSFGGAATMFGIHNGLQIKRLVNIGTPTDADYITADFLRRINASPDSGVRFREKILNDFGHPYDYYSVKETIKSAGHVSLLMIHDRTDKEVPVQHSIDLHEANPETELVITEGLGHMRILKDPEVIAKAINFVSEPVEELVVI